MSSTLTTVLEPATLQLSPWNALWSCWSPHFLCGLTDDTNPCSCCLCSHFPVIFWWGLLHEININCCYRRWRGEEPVDEGRVGLRMTRGCEVLVFLVGVLALSCGSSTDMGSEEIIQGVEKVGILVAIILFSYTNAIIVQCYWKLFLEFHNRMWQQTI